MALPIWTQDALRSNAKPFTETFWRCVEAQYLVSTLALVDTLGEQHLLEDILEDTKPSAPEECRRLHYLYMTPFRYGLYPKGSRFRKAGATPGVFYASAEPKTAVIETAFHMLLFYTDSPSTPFPKKPTEHTVFDVPIEATSAIDLTADPFVSERELWRAPTDYSACQELEERARSGGIDLILYGSVRDPNEGLNGAILKCSAFAAEKPSITQTWQLWFNAQGVHTIESHGPTRATLAPMVFSYDPRFEDLNWDR